MKRCIHFFLTVSLFMGFSLAQAKRFTSQFCEFELPPGWDCQLEGSEWVCQSSNEDRKRETIIILAAKIRGQHDDIDQYMAYLKKPKTFSLPGGQSQISESKYSKVATINGHRWVDSLHMASEIPGFYTRYLATVKEDLGVVITLSVSKDHYNSYQDVFDKIVNTIRVFRQKAANAGNFKLAKKDEDLFARRSQTWIDDNREKADISNQRQGKAGSTGQAGDMLLWIILALALAAGVVLVKLKAKKK